MSPVTRSPRIRRTSVARLPHRRRSIPPQLKIDISPTKGDRAAEGKDTHTADKRLVQEPNVHSSEGSYFCPQIGRVRHRVCQIVPRISFPSFGGLAKWPTIGYCKDSAKSQKDVQRLEDRTAFDAFRSCNKFEGLAQPFQYPIVDHSSKTWEGDSWNNLTDWVMYSSNLRTKIAFLGGMDVRLLDKTPVRSLCILSLSRSIPFGRGQISRTRGNRSSHRYLQSPYQHVQARA